MLLLHYHYLSSPILCPLCFMAVYLSHRIAMIGRPLHNRDFLFVFVNYKGEVFPMTSDKFRAALKVACKHSGLQHSRPHDLKHGILGDIWKAAVLQISTYKPDLRAYLCVADHQPDYSQKYIIPDLRVITRMIHSIRDGLLTEFLSELSDVETNRLQAQWISALPTLLPPQELKRRNEKTAVAGVAQSAAAQYAAGCTGNPSGCRSLNANSDGARTRPD